jgi:hypothetical protein
MKNGFTAHHWANEEGKPAGGVSYGTGFSISWQNGPLGRGEDRKEPNGAFVEDIINVIKDRLEFYQQGEFASKFNERALTALAIASFELENRTMDRESRGVEGTHEQ